jgi:hypothetical protein
MRQSLGVVDERTHHLSVGRFVVTETVRRFVD